MAILPLRKSHKTTRRRAEGVTLDKFAPNCNIGISTIRRIDTAAGSPSAVDEAVDRNHRKPAGKRNRFRSLTEALDTTTAQGRLVFHMFGALAEFERSLIRERTQAGLAAARRAGRPPKLTDDDIEAAKALLANPDIGVTQITHRLGVSLATLYRYIPAARTASALAFENSGYRSNVLESPVQRTGPECLRTGRNAK
jgi:Resolvase, N terminal domain/Helix-turn-helix domain of resolvase